MRHFHQLPVRVTVTSGAHQVLGLAQGVLHVREAEAGHRDELTHHRHKLIARHLWLLLLVLQLLSGGERETEYELEEKHKQPNRQTEIY